MEASTPSAQSNTRLPCLLYQADFLYVGRFGMPFPCVERPVPHGNGYAFGFVEAGHLWLGMRGDARSVVAQGQYYLLPPDHPYAPQLNSYPRTLFITLPQQRVDLLREEGIAIAPGSLLRPVIGNADRRVRAVLDAITDETNNPAAGTRLMLESLSLQLLIHVLRDQHSSLNTDENRSTNTLLSPEIRRSIDFMHAHLSDDVSLDELAGVASLSRYHFLRVFKRQTGLTPHAYLRSVQLQQAVILLRTSNASIGAIALQVGFASPGHLSDAFKRQHGITPSAFRAEQRNQL